MLLQDVIPGSPADAGRVEITELAYDTRQVIPGTLFFCVPGFTRDGHEFAGEAIARGCSARSKA
jgi:UDP-N-acetylmuramoyl-L-alanyl-D-glutamate--2,6-diaminopimelate ligase